MIGPKHFALLVLIVSIAFAPSVLQQADAQNRPPQGDAKALPTNPSAGDEVELGEGTFSFFTDPDGDMLEYSWMVFGPAGNMEEVDHPDINSPDATFTPQVEGSYNFVLFVNDGNSVSQREVNIKVDDVSPTAPTVFSPTSVEKLEGSVTFDGAGDKGHTIRVDWTRMEGGSGNFLLPTGPPSMLDKIFFDHTRYYFLDGTYTFEFFQIDGDGNESAPTWRQIMIITSPTKKTAFNLAPFGQIGPIQTEIVALALVGEGLLPLATDPDNLLGDSIDGYGFVDSRVEIDLAPCAQSTGDYVLFDALGREGLTEISSGEEFFSDPILDLFFDLTITDIDARPGRDYAAGLGPSFQRTCVSPSQLTSSGSIFANTGLPNLGSTLQLSSLDHFIFDPIALGVDVNGDLTLDSLDFLFNTMSLTNPQQFEENGNLVTDFDATLPFSGDVNPPFNVNMAGVLQLSEQVLVPEGTAPDADGDGVEDSSDNCLNTPNTGQGNLDSDTLGDACDPNTEPTTNKFLTVDTTLGGDLTVDGTSFTIPSGITVDFDFVNNKLIIKNPDGKILIQGKIT